MGRSWPVRRGGGSPVGQAVDLPVLEVHVDVVEHLDAVRVRAGGRPAPLEVLSAHLQTGCGGGGWRRPQPKGRGRASTARPWSDLRLGCMRPGGPEVAAARTRQA